MRLINGRIVDKIQWVEKGNCYGYNVTGIVAVEDLGENKKLIIHYTYDDKNWSVVEGRYVKKTGSGIEIWSFETPINLPESKNEIYFCKFAIQYQSGDKEYWDNNQGKDYCLCINHENSYDCNVRYALGDINVSLVSYDRGCNYNKYNKDFIIGTILLRNLGYNKDVRIRYTTDNWLSYKEEKAYYKDYNSNNIEIWSFTLEDIPQDTKVQFCISYTVNGEIYWDNNFGDNYEG